MNRTSLLASKTRRDRYRRRWAASVEPLEGRALLATYSWSGPTDGNFNDPTMWIGPGNIHAVPGPGDDAILGIGNYTVSVTGSATINSLDDEAALNVKAGTFAVTGASNSTSSTVNNLSVAAGAAFHSGRVTRIVGSGVIAGNLDAAAGSTVTLTGSLNAINLQAGATLTGPGTFDIISSVNVEATVTAPSNLILDSGNSAGIEGPGTLNVPSGATLDWRSGYMIGVGGATNILAGATLLIDSNNAKTLTDRALNNAGTASLANSGILTIDQVAVFINSGSMTIQNDQPIGGQGTLVNRGTLTKTSGSPSGLTDLTARFNNSGTVVLQSGILQLDNGSGGSIFTGNFNSPASGGTLEITGRGYALNQGTSFTGPGTVHFTSGFLGAASITLNGNVTVPNLAVDSAVVTGTNGTLTVTGTLSINSGTLSIALLTLPAGSGLNMTGTNVAVFDKGLFNDSGTSTLSGSEQFQLTNGATFQNAGKFTIQDDQPMGGQGTFVNYGFFTKTSPVGTGTTDLTTTFNNSGGVVILQSGVLQLDNGSVGGAFTGNFNSPASGGTLEITGRGYALNQGTSFTGPGTVHFTSGFLGAASIALNGNVTIPSLAVDNASVTGPGALNVSGTLSVNTGILSIGTLNVASGATFNLNGSHTATFDTGTFNNAGSFTISGAESFSLTNGATFNNSGSFLIVNDTTGTSGNIGLGANTFFVNGPSGIITKVSAAGTGTTNISNGNFTNRGVIHTISGQLLLEDTGVNTGTFYADPNSTLALTRNWTLNPGTNVGGAGVLTIGIGFFGYGTILVNANVTAPNFALPGGVLAVSPSFTFTVGSLNWTGGQINGTGTVAIQAGGKLTISGSATKTLSQATLTNAGTATWSGTGIISLDSGAAIFNQAGATFNATNDQTISGGSGGTFNNSGTLNKTSLTGVGTTTFTVALNNLLGGVINLASGNLTTGSVVNLGTISLGVQTAFNVGGDYGQTFGGTLIVAVGGAPATNLFGQLTVSGQAKLNGTLTVNLANNFRPTNGQSTPIVTFGSVAGKFLNLNLATVGSLPVFTPTLKAAEYDLVVAPPAAPTGLALASGFASGGANSTRSTTPMFTGTTQPFAGVQIGAVVNGVYTLFAVAIAGADGTFTTTTIKAFAPGTYTLFAVAYNGIGSGPASLPFTLTVLA